MKNKLFILGCSILLSFALKAQMKVGDNPTTINSASLLELETSNKGLVFPRVSLTDVASSSPLPAGLLTGTTVYNTNAAITNGNGIGLYIWGGTVWMSINTGLTSATAWSLTGNAGTNYATNFIGTTDNVGFRVRTNNLQRISVDSLGNVAIGSAATVFDPNNRERFLVDYGVTTSRTVANFKGSINDYLQLNIQNTNSGNKASSDFVATADDGTDSTFYVDMGINSSTYNPTPGNWGNKHDAYFYSNSRNLLMGTQADSSDVFFLLGGGQVKTNAALQIKGPQGVIVVGKGELSDAPVGNTIRGPSASPGVSNLAGGELSLAGGSSTGTVKGGDLNLSGGSSVTGPGGIVNINTAPSTGNTRIGSGANNIILPKFSTIGGLYYTSFANGQLSTTGANMTWDSINNRLGIGTTTPAYKLHVIAAADPLYLGGLQTTPNSTDSFLTISNGVVKTAVRSPSSPPIPAWQLAGNSGTTTSNFLGTIDNINLRFRTNNIERMVIDNTGKVGIGITAPPNALSVLAATNPLYLSGVQATSTFTTDSILTINAGIVKKAPYSSLGTDWSLTGNTGTKPNINFIGTIDTAAFVVRTNNVEHMRILGTGNAGWISMGAGGTPRSPVDMTGNFTGKNILTIQNTANTGYSSVDMFDNNGTQTGTFGYANAGVAGNPNIAGRDYFFFYGKDFIMSIGAGGASGSNPDFFVQGSTGNIGFNTNTPAAKVDVSGPVILGANGTTITAVIDTTNVIATTQATQIATSTMGTATVTVTNALVNSPVVVSPRTFPGNPFVIAYARVTGANTVTIGIYNTSGAAINASATFRVDVVVINP